jgi:hypothetical protein
VFVVSGMLLLSLFCCISLNITPNLKFSKVKLSLYLSN